LIGLVTALLATALYLRMGMHAAAHSS
jgi:hypothetical protein